MPTMAIRSWSTERSWRNDRESSPTTRVGAEFHRFRGLVRYPDRLSIRPGTPNSGRHWMLVGGTYAPLEYSQRTQHASPPVMSEDTTLSIPVADMLKNDTDPDGDTLSVTS